MSSLPASEGWHSGWFHSCHLSRGKQGFERLSSSITEKQALKRDSSAGGSMLQILRDVWSREEGQDIAEYAVMLAVILVIVIGTVRLIGSNANTVFSGVANSMQ